MGGGGGKAPKASSGEKALARIAQDLYSATDPARQEFLSQGLGLARGEIDPRSMPGFRTANELMQEQTGRFFGDARDQILANVPAGATGLQSTLLAEAATAGAETRAGLANQIAQQLMMDRINKAFGLAGGAVQPAMGALGVGAQTGAQRRAVGGQAAARWIPQTSLNVGLGKE
jgi:hypothetical protein